MSQATVLEPSNLQTATTKTCPTQLGVALGKGVARQWWDGNQNIRSMNTTELALIPSKLSVQRPHGREHRLLAMIIT